MKDTTRCELQQLQLQEVFKNERVMECECPSEPDELPRGPTTTPVPVLCSPAHSPPPAYRPPSPRLPPPPETAPFRAPSCKQVGWEEAFEGHVHRHSPDDSISMR